LHGHRRSRLFCGNLVAHAAARRRVESEPWSVDNSDFHEKWAKRPKLAKKPRAV
jgi:hypothetical protein